MCSVILSFYKHTSPKGRIGGEKEGRITRVSEQRRAPFVYLHIETDIGNTTSSIVQINGQLIQRQLLLEELAEVTLQQIPTGPLFDTLRPRKTPQPRHLARLLALSRYIYVYLHRGETTNASRYTTWIIISSRERARCRQRACRPMESECLAARRTISHEAGSEEPHFPDTRNVRIVRVVRDARHNTNARRRGRILHYRCRRWRMSTLPSDDGRRAALRCIYGRARTSSIVDRAPSTHPTFVTIGID